MTNKIESIVREIANRVGITQEASVDNWVEKWTAFVATVETGYDLSVYDYTNDLSVRDLLEEVIAQMDPDDPARLSSRIEPWDRRFRDATVPSRQLLGSAPDSSGWWWHRRPKILAGELLSDLDPSESPSSL